MKSKNQLFGAESARIFGGRSKSKNREQTPLAQRGRLNVPSKKRRRVKRGFDAIFNAEESSTSLVEEKENNAKLTSKQLKAALDAFSSSSSDEEEEDEKATLVMPRKRTKVTLKAKLFTHDNVKLPSSTPLTHR